LDEKSFFEQPTGEYATAVDAMESAIVRLRSLQVWDRWITLCAQGEGEQPEAVRFAEVRLLSDILHLAVPLDVEEITALANVPRHALVPGEGGRYSVVQASPREVAQILDAVFRHQLGVRPFADDDGDYAVGGEW
jgi:hypothetical protein